MFHNLLFLVHHLNLLIFIFGFQWFWMIHEVIKVLKEKMALARDEKKNSMINILLYFLQPYL